MDYLPGPIERIASPLAGRRWYCVAYSDSCLHVHTRSERAAREAARSTALPWARPTTVTRDTCAKTGLQLPIIRR